MIPSNKKSAGLRPGFREYSAIAPEYGILGAVLKPWPWLRSALDHISHKVLTDTLRRAERDGLVARHVDRNRVGIDGTPVG